MTGPDCCAVMCNLMKIHTHTHMIPPREDQCVWHRMTRMTGPDCVVMCNLINTHTHTCTMCGLEKLGLVDQNWLERNLSGLMLRTLLVVGRRQQSESIEVALVME